MFLISRFHVQLADRRVIYVIQNILKIITSLAICVLINPLEGYKKNMFFSRCYSRKSNQKNLKPLKDLEKIIEDIQFVSCM